MYTNLKTLRRHIFHALQHFASKLGNSTNFRMLFLTVVINTYLLRPRETVCFVDQRLSMFPEAKPRETSTVEGPQNMLLSRGLSQ